jgi:MFS family permease
VTGRPPAAGSDLLTAGYRTRFIVILFLVATFNFADRSVFAATAQTIKQDLGLDDSQLGLLQGLVFASLYSILGLPIGWLAERINRLRIIAVSVGFWSAMTMLCSLVGSFPQMFLARAGVGVGEAGYMAPTNSLASDLFPARRRATVMALIMLGSPAGALLGAVTGGWFAQHHSWREGFLAMGAPGLVLTFIVLAMLKEPARGLVERGVPHTAPAASFSVVLAHIWRTPALRLVMIGGTLAQFGMTAISQFMAPFFARTYHLPPAQAATAFGLVSAAALTLGLLLGALGTDKAGQKDLRWSAWGPAIGLACAAPLYVIAFNQPTVVGSVIFLLAGGASLLCYYGPALGMIQNMVGPNMRATAASIYAVSYGLLGLGLGPTFAGFLSESFARNAFTLGNFAELCKGGRAAPGSTSDLLQACASASADGLQGSLTCLMAVFALAALVFLLAARSYRHDIYRPEDPSQGR